VELEAELDRLYQVLPNAFVAERNKLARVLRASGDREAAERISRLTRPSPVAWVVNQLHFREPACIDALREAGNALRKAQESAAGNDEYTASKRTHQQSLRSAMDRVAPLAEEGGIKATVEVKRRIEATLTLLSAAQDGVDPPPGRMSAELSPLGFDALSEVATTAPPGRREAPKALQDAELSKKIEGVKASLDAAERELRRLEHEAKLARAKHERATRDAEDAERRADEARRSRDDARRETDEATDRFDTARRDVEAARRELSKLQK
jgi:hypothetical protein